MPNVRFTDSSEMIYFFIHVRSFAYANYNFEPVTDWREAQTFTSMDEADSFFMEMCDTVGSWWNMCESSEELWNLNGGRITNGSQK